MKLARDPRLSGMAPVMSLHSPDDMGGPTVSESVVVYLAAKRGRGEFTAGSAAKAAATLRRMIEACGDPHTRKVDKDYAEMWLTSIAGSAKSTRRHYWSIVNCFFEWCVDEELVGRNPFRTVKPPKPSRRVPRPLTGEAVGRVLDAAWSLDGPRGRLMVTLMVQMGFRCQGVAQLELGDLDLGAGWVRLEEKGGHERVLSIPVEAAEAIGVYLDRYPEVSAGPLVRQWRKPGYADMSWVALSLSERPLSAAGVSKLVTGFMYEAGVKHAPGDGVSPHALRHTCATDMLEAGASIMEVSAALGHASVGTTMVYTQVRPASLVRAMGGRRYGDPGLTVAS